MTLDLAGATPSTLGCNTPVLAEIIIPVWNHLDDLTKRVVASVRGNTVVPYRLIIVDDGSTDGTAEWLATQDDIITIVSKANQGHAPATNRGLRISTAPYVVLMNNDVTVSKGWLKLLIEGLEAHPGVGAISPACICRATQPPGADGVAIQRNPPGSACLVLRREVVQELGLLDEQATGVSDADYSYRMKLAGWKFALHHGVHATHDVHATLRDAGDPSANAEAGWRYLEKKWPDVPIWRGMTPWE